MEKIKAEEVIGIIPDELLDKLSLEYNVDCSVKKLKGKVILELFLYGIISGKNISLRILEAIFKSEKFQHLFQIKNKKIRHSGIGMRINKIDYRYFENIFHYLIGCDKIEEIFFSQKRIRARKIDSTLVLLSSKLLKVGMNDNPGKKSLKYCVEFQEIPVNIILFKDQKYLSEENALPEVVTKKALKNGLNIAIFDRGIRRKKSFVEFSQQKINFISRLTNHCYDVIEKLEVKEKFSTTLELLSDEIIKFNNKQEKIDEEFRLVVGRNIESREIIKFITNVRFLSAAEITDLYKSRWEIETFFKFIKQELNFSHLLSRSENGIRVVMFLTMIAAILLTMYKKVNKIIGWTVAKIMFLDELERRLMKSWTPVIQTVFYPKNNDFLAKIRGG